MKPSLPDFLRHPLGREIAVAVAVKLAVILAIFYAFFHGNTVATDPDAVAKRLADPQQQISH
jgi:preprotein translocase subunit SecY